ncbi:hypothetical protein [Sporomusa termitida]|uniref:hypothetical protein n=1 Tax=Sporomusa termitida TaxID=2377 RepID=UPI0011847EBB|nr:hypothetical protein [Sporomusa termitida]
MSAVAGQAGLFNFEEVKYATCCAVKRTAPRPRGAGGTSVKLLLQESQRIVGGKLLQAGIIS